MARKRQRGLTEPSGGTHLSLISPLTLVVLQVSDRVSLRVRITLLAACTLTSGGATGTANKSKGSLRLSSSPHAPAHIHLESLTWPHCQVVVM